MILVTGASGYVGSHIVRKLVDAGKPVRAMVFNKERAEREERLKELAVEWVQGDVTRSDTLLQALEGVDMVVHTVAVAIEKGDRTYESINYQGTVNLVDASLSAGVKRFINISQMGADANLPYRFLASKGKAQAYVAGSELSWTALRPSVIWGPEDEFANTFAKLVPITPIIFPIVGDEDAKFQPVWVGDVATAVVKCLDDPETIGKTFELGGPEILTLEEIERRTLEAVGSNRIMVRFPMPLLRVVVRLMELVLPAPPVTGSLLELLAVPNVAEENQIDRFVDLPRPFTSENIRPYMRKFKVRDTLNQFLGF
jgi:NADH dehydrogenase